MYNVRFAEAFTPTKIALSLTETAFMSRRDSNLPDGVVIGDPPDSSTASFWVSGLASPFKSWGERAENYLAAVRSNSQEKQQTSLNSQFGELFQIGGRGAAPEWAEVYAHRGLYARGEPVRDDGLLFLTVDVQKNRLIWLVRLWCKRFESFLVDYAVLWGRYVRRTRLERSSRADAHTDWWGAYQFRAGR